MGKILQTDNIFTIAEIDATYKKLPLGVYNLNVSQKGFYLSKASDFKVPDKIYGDLSCVDRWLKTYNEKTRNVGVLLSGLKGGGKTITAKVLAMKANKPIIIISQPFHGPDFNDFITDPALGDCVIFIDEFEKIYSPNRDNGDGNDSLLSLLDGPYETHHLFIFTVNQTTINSNLINRPSRILYAKRYEGLSDEDIVEIANDKLVNKDLMEDLLRNSRRIFQLSFDILISIIDEMNRFNEPASKCMEYMNLTPKQVTFNATQWYINEEGKIDKDYAAWNNALTYDDDGLFLNCEYHYILINHNGNKTYHYTNIELDVQSPKKVANNTYEVVDKDICTVYTLTENENQYYGYGSRNSYRPKEIEDVLLTVWLDENDNYVKHVPEKITVEKVKELIGNHFFNENNSRNKLMPKDCYDEEQPCINDLYCDCEGECAG